MPRLYISGNAVDQNDVPVVGALIYVRAAGVNASLEDAAGGALPNPLIAVADGFFEAYSTSTGTHTLEYYWGGRLRYIEAVSEIDRIQAIADEAESAAQIAAALTGPLYATTFEGLDGTASGDEFAVDNGDGTAGIYINDSGSQTLVRTIILAPSNAATAALIGTTAGTLQAVLTDFEARIAALEP